MPNLAVIYVPLLEQPHIIRMKDGVLVEHWDVIHDEATQEQSKSGNPMFGETFPDRAGERMKSNEQLG